MSDKTTPSGRALEWFNTQNVIGIKHPQQGKHIETIRRALMIADVVESGELEKMDLNVSDYGLKAEYLKGHDDGWNECLERLKGIGAGE